MNQTSNGLWHFCSQG